MMDSSLGDSRQVRVHFTTDTPDLELPESQRQLLVPSDIKRYGLSKVLNSESMLDTPSPIPFDFLINGAFLRTSLEDYLKENGLSFESTLTVKYVRSLLPPSFQASFEHDDWISDVDTLSATSRAGLWSGSKLAAGQNRVLTASYDGLLRIWDDSGSVLATSQGGHSASAKAAKFVSSSQVVSAGLDRTVRIWKYSEGEDRLSGELKPTLELYGHTASIDSLDVHGPTGRILSAGADGCIGLWSTSKATAPPAPENLLPGSGGGITSSSSNKKRKIGGVSNGGAQRGALSLTQVHAASSPATAAIFHPTDPTVAYTASQDHTIRTLDLTTAHVVSTLTTSHPLLSLCSLGRGSSSSNTTTATSNTTGLLAAGTSARHITLVDPRSSSASVSVLTLRGHRNMVTSLASSPDNDYSLVSGSHDGTCRVWDIRSVRSGGGEGNTSGGSQVSESVYVIEREKGGKKKSSDVPGQGQKVFGVAWDKHWGIVSGGEDKQLQVNRGRDLVSS